jgi:hypothetical protein
VKEVPVIFRVPLCGLLIAPPLTVAVLPVKLLLTIVAVPEPTLEIAPPLPVALFAPAGVPSPKVLFTIVAVPALEIAPPLAALNPINVNDAGELAPCGGKGVTPVPRNNPTPAPPADIVTLPKLLNSSEPGAGSAKIINALLAPMV